VPRQLFLPSITTSCQVWRRWTYPLPNYSVFAADTLLYAVTLTYDPVTLTFNLWPWTFAAYRLWRDETMYEIWTLSNSPRRSYCDFSVCPHDLEHVLSVALGSEVIFTKFTFNNLSFLRGTWTRLHQTIGHRAIIAALHFCFRIRICCCIFKCGRFKVERYFKRCQFSHFVTLWKLGEGWARFLY